MAGDGNWNPTTQVTLDLTRDPHARAAVLEYARRIEQLNPGLAQQLRRSVEVLGGTPAAGTGDGIGARPRTIHP